MNHRSCETMNTQLYLMASSNENTSGYSFSPSELYCDANGNCFEETYSSRQLASETGETALISTGSIEHYCEFGYWNVTSVEIEKRWNTLRGEK